MESYLIKLTGSFAKYVSVNIYTDMKPVCQITLTVRGQVVRYYLEFDERTKHLSNDPKAIGQYISEKMAVIQRPGQPTFMAPKFLASPAAVDHLPHDH